MIKNCQKCGDKPHSQDEIHGKGMRVINEHKTKIAIVQRCTVCGDEKSTPTHDKSNQTD